MLHLVPEDGAAVLGAHIITLPIFCCGVHMSEEGVQQLLVTDLCGVIYDLCTQSGNIKNYGNFMKLQVRQQTTDTRHHKAIRC